MFLFNGIDFEPLLKVEEIRRPILAPQALTTMSIPGRPGALLVRKQSDPYTVEVDIALKEVSKENVTAKSRQLAELLFTEAEAQLVFKDEPDVYYSATLSDDTPLEQTIKLGKTTLMFFVPDPFRYLVSNTGDTLTRTTPGTSNFTRTGNTDSYPTVEITGTSGSSGKFTIATDNNQMTFTGTLESGEVLVIDSKELTAYIIQTDGTQVSALRNLDDLDFPVLTKGANSFTVTTASGAVLTQCVLRYNSRWL